jgi:hypothetical protein
MKLLKRFNIGIKNNIFRSAFKREFDITEDELMALTNFQKAFIYIRDKDLPTPEENWELISSRQASQILLGRYSHQAIIDMAKVDKVFRLSGTKLYKKEIDLYLKYLIWEDAMYGTGFLMDSKDDLGRDVIVVLKKSIKKDGKPEFKQRMAALEQSIKDPQVWAFMEKLRSIN